MAESSHPRIEPLDIGIWSCCDDVKGCRFRPWPPPISLTHLGWSELQCAGKPEHMSTSYY